MEKKPFFSVIIPTYNSADKLRRALNSVFKQTFRDFEVIVCDDGSTDNTKEVVSEWRGKFDIKYVWEENWGGPARPRNNGLKIAAADYIAFLDTDDWWYPRKLEIVSNYIADTDIIYHDLDIHTPKGKKIMGRVKGRVLKSPVFADLMKNENALMSSSVAVRKSIVEAAGGFSEDKSLISLEDFELWLKIARITEKFFYIPKKLGVYWIGKSNISGPSEEKIKKIERIYVNHMIQLNEEDREQAESIKSYLLARTRQKLGQWDEAAKLFGIAASSRNHKFRNRSFFWIGYLWFLRKFNRQNKVKMLQKK